MRVIKAPNDYSACSRPWLFLSGSIEMGAAEKWQERCEKLLVHSPGTILNPRRDDWDSTWVQTADNPQFREQVLWELEAMDKADEILLYFDPKSSAPITLLEFGLHARIRRGSSGLIRKRSHLIVCCPDGFYRKGNVDIVCQRYGVTQRPNLEDLVELYQSGMNNVSDPTPTPK